MISKELESFYPIFLSVNLTDIFKIISKYRWKIISKYRQILTTTWEPSLRVNSSRSL